MSAYKIQSVAGLHDPVSGALVGFLGANGMEYLFPIVEGPYATYGDSSGAPGAATLNTVRGKAAIAAAAASVVITDSFVTATSQVLVVLEANDATLLYVKSVVPSAGSFIVTGVATATAAVNFKFVVIN